MKCPHCGGEVAFGNRNKRPGYHGMLKPLLPEILQWHDNGDTVAQITARLRAMPQPQNPWQRWMPGYLDIPTHVRYLLRREGRFVPASAKQQSASGQIVDLWKAGFRKAEIARRVGRSPTRVSAVIAKYERKQRNHLTGG
jgi:hypothetical protein